MAVDVFLYGGEPNPNDVRLRSDGGETIAVDKWYKQHENPVRKGLQVAAIVSSFFFVEAPAQAEVITVDKWYQPVSQPQNKVVVRQQAGQTFLDVPRTVLLTDWFQPISQPDRKIKIRLTAGDTRIDVVAEVVTVDKWGQPTNQPRIKIKPFILNGVTITDVIIVSTGNSNFFFFFN